MGILQDANELNKLIGEEPIFEIEDSRSIAEMIEDQIEINKEKPSLNQITNFRHYAEQDEHLQIFDWNNNNLDRISLDEFNNVKRLWNNRNYLQMKQILEKYLKLK